MSARRTGEAVTEPAHYRDLAAVEDVAWAMLAAAVQDRRVAFHEAAVATVTAEGRPAVRTVVLRAADRAAGTVGFHTDKRSHKFAELGAGPSAEILFYDHDAKVQVRLRGSTSLHNDDPLAATVWARTSEMSRQCYRQKVGPGTPLEASDAAAGEALSEAAGFANFVVVSVAIVELEWLYLAAAGHRRALLCYGSSPSARWIAP